MRITLLLSLTGALIPALLAAQSAPASPAASRTIAVKAKKAPPPRTVERPPFIDFLDGQHALADTFRFALSPGRPPIVIPRGFVTDFASIPALVKPIFAGLPHDIPGMVHDFLYWTQVCGKEQADRVFENLLEQLGVSHLKSEAMYLAVDNFGSSAWKENHRDRASGLPRIIPPDYMHISTSSVWSQYRSKLRARHVTLDTPDPGLAEACKP